jgi:hypothetical protein
MGLLPKTESILPQRDREKSALGFIDGLKADVDRIGDALKPI